MRSQLRPESRQDAPASPRSRSSSISTPSASPSTRASGILAIPFSTSPAPAYVAASSASESVQNAVNERPLSDEIGSVIFADAALTQINSFLDTLLYNILSNSQSSTLSRIKPAVDVVIKGALGQRAIASGERELEDLLGDGEDDDEIDMEEKEQDSATSWDLDYVFRRTRLRLMVYMSLATMDDDEEERHVHDSQLNCHIGEDREHFSQLTGLVSWKALMFLTAVLEYLAEACLKDAGQFAYARASVSRPSEEVSTSGTASATNSTDDRLVITATDVRKLNLSPSLGRLWRSWKKVTSGTGSSPRLSQQAWQSALALKRTSLIAVTGDESLLQRRPVEALGGSEDHPTVELPRRPNSDQTPTRRTSPLQGPNRSRSFVRFPVAVAPSGPRSWQGSWQSRNSAEPVAEVRPRHVRSSSLPPPRLSVFTMPSRPRPDDAATLAHETTANREAVVIGPSTSTTPVTETSQQKQARESETTETAAAESTSSVPVAQVSVSRTVTPVETVPELEEDGTDGMKYTEPLASATKEQQTSSETHFRSEAASSETLAAAPVPPVRQLEEPILPMVKEEPTITTPEATAPLPQPLAEGDEYDPYRVDATVKSAKSPQATLPSSAVGEPHNASEPKHAQKYTFEDSDEETSSERSGIASKKAGTVIAGSAGVAATTGAVISELRKKGKPAPIMTTPNPANKATTQPIEAGSRQISRAAEPDMRAEIVSPLKMSPVHASDYQTPSGAVTATSSGTADDRNLEEFVTPPRSPAQKTSLEKASPMPVTTSDGPVQPKFSTTKDLSPRSEGTNASRSGQKQSSSGSLDEQGSPKSPSGHSEKEFNQMINGQRTVKRSLTPKDLTDIEKPDSSTRRQDAVKSVVVPNETFLFDESTAPPLPAKPGSGPNGSLPAEATIVRNAKKAAPPPSDEPYIPKSPSWSTPSLNSKPSKSGLMARESRVPHPGSTAELAEFFRSTAPDRPPADPKPFVASGQAMPAVGKPQVSQINTGNGSYAPKSGSNLARLSSFRGGRGERQGNEDLIAFLNEGPPGARVNKTQSMETTSSSANAGISPARRSASPISHAPSFNESINSRSNLISSGRRGGSNTALAAESPRSPAAPAANRPAGNAAPKPMGGAPVRKQRRIKDPYAIDLDDEDEEGDDILMGLPNKREEGMSMIDFLRSSEPPARAESSAPAKPASKPGLSNKEMAAARAAATASPSIPDFLRDPSRGPSRRSSRDSFGSGFLGDKTRRSSTKANGTESKSRFSFWRSSKVN